jgi:hypothetical protein
MSGVTPADCAAEATVNPQKAKVKDRAVKEGNLLCIASIFSRLAAQPENTISVTIESAFDIQ